jgi:hypothetical protein
MGDLENITQDPRQAAQLFEELQRQLDDQRTLANRKREEEAIAREKMKMEKEALVRVNGHLLKQLQSLRRAEQRNSGGDPMQPPSPSK